MRRAEPGTAGSARAPFPGCPICAKHRGEGPLGGRLVGIRDGLRVYHAAPGDDGRAALGHLFIETERHVPSLADLAPEEAAAVGRLRSELARALLASLDAERVFAVVLGTHVPHFHEHLVTRHRGTPSEVPWHQSDEAAPRADAAEVGRLSDRIAAALGLREASTD